MKRKKTKKCPAPGGVRTRDLRFSTLGGYMAGTAYKYDALTDCATGARRIDSYCSFDVLIALTLNRF